MNRFRWFSLKLPNSLNGAIDSIKGATPFGHLGFGFVIVENTSHNRHKFRYIRKSLVKVPTLTINGGLTYQNIESISELTFEIFEKNSKFWLKVEDPPRTVRDLLEAIENTLGFGFSAKSFVFSLEHQKIALMDFDVSRMIGFRGIGSSAINKFLARIDVASKEGIEPKNLKILEELDFKVDQTTYEVSYRMLKGQVTFTPSGLVRSAGAVSPFIIDCLESAL